ncbi:DNA mismatch endonuclease Vsr [Stappia sp. GBMRC 2046]|uniref:Very short patch repair endonuclease n=2 Tax=Stappia sediminis TaxID=2692190 RepID=A0A7X3S996_9HYPH|nr:DNA mismatch endonuclease Vsr [Stappia sediminis]
MDVLTPDQRRKCMSHIRAKNTKPELAVRRVAHALGYRFRVHRTDLPGKPDLVFPSRRKVIFVHGCFWHRHEGCKLASSPKSNLDYWVPKFERTTERDQSNIEKLSEKGWNSYVIWECEIRDVELLAKSIVTFLDS